MSAPATITISIRGKKMFRLRAWLFCISNRIGIDFPPSFLFAVEIAR